MERLIFFFSATGNSLYVAEQLKGKGGTALSIPQLMKHNQFEFEADEIGFVYPIYMHLPPQMVKDFIARVRMKANYFFAVLTYGNRTCNAVELWQDIASKNGYHFDYVNTFIMVDNWLHHFDMEQQKAINKHIPEQLEVIQRDIDERKVWTRPVTEEERKLHEEAFHKSGLYKTDGFNFKSEEHFEINDDCISCGICVKVCPRANWSLGNEKAETIG